MNKGKLVKINTTLRVYAENDNITKMAALQIMKGHRCFCCIINLGSIRGRNVFLYLSVLVLTVCLMVGAKEGSYEDDSYLPSTEEV